MATQRSEYDLETDWLWYCHPLTPPFTQTQSSYCTSCSDWYISHFHLMTDRTTYCTRWSATFTYL